MGSNAEQLTRLLMKHRQMLLAYIYTLLLDHHKAEDILQETAVTLIRRADEFGEIGHFWPLVREIARRHSLAARRKDAEAPLYLSEKTLVAIEAGFVRAEKTSPWGHDALRICLGKLPSLWQTIIKRRYWSQWPVKQIAEDLGRSTNTVSVSLNRARLRLADCVSRTLRMGEFL